MESCVKHVFILNPAAGKSEGKADLHAEIEQVCLARGVEFEIHPTSEPGEATAFVDAYCTREPKTQLRFYACGGDGTLSETVSGAYGHPNAAVTPDKPQQFEEMKALAAKLSEGIPHVRMDFYEVGGQIYFGEYTFYHWSGFVPFDPESADEWMGSLIKLPEKKWRG